MSYSIFQDWTYNKKNIKGRLILISYRIAHIASWHDLLFILFIPYLILYKLLVEWLLCCELPYKTKIGKGLVVFHGFALVINDGTIIGRECTFRHSTTIGNKKQRSGSYSRSPVIGNAVDVGSNVCIIGPITIGDNVIIGAGSVIVKDIPSNSVVAGNPARIIKTLNNFENTLTTHTLSA